MNAPKRTRQQKAEWRQPNEIPVEPKWFRKSVLEYVGAREALNDITGSMLAPDLIWKTLWELACRRNERKQKASQWYSIAGLTLVRLRRFPKKVRGWADEFELMLREFQKNRAYGSVANSLALYLRHGQSAEKKRGRVPETVASNILNSRATFSKMLEIPQMLRLYADYFEGVCKVSADLAPNAPGLYRDGLVGGLIDSVMWTTGNAKYEQIALLMTAAYRAYERSGLVETAGDVNEEPTEIVDAHNLRMQHSRTRRRK